MEISQGQQKTEVKDQDYILKVLQSLTDDEELYVLCLSLKKRDELSKFVKSMDNDQLNYIRRLLAQKSGFELKRKGHITITETKKNQSRLLFFVVVIFIAGLLFATNILRGH